MKIIQTKYGIGIFATDDDIPPYKQRFIKEYKELKTKYNKLHKIIIKYEANTLDFELSCPIELLKEQAKYMGNYLRVLEIRAEIEKIEL